MYTLRWALSTLFKRDLHALSLFGPVALLIAGTIFTHARPGKQQHSMHNLTGPCYLILQYSCLPEIIRCQFSITIQHEKRSSSLTFACMADTPAMH